MTREQIEELREMQASVPPGVEVDTWRLDPDDFEDLLAAAERVLLLEDVLAAAKAYITTTSPDVSGMDFDDVMQAVDYARKCQDNLRAAIDRAEVKP